MYSSILKRLSLNKTYIPIKHDFQKPKMFHIFILVTCDSFFKLSLKVLFHWITTIIRTLVYIYYWNITYFYKWEILRKLITHSYGFLCFMDWFRRKKCLLKAIQVGWYLILKKQSVCISLSNPEILIYLKLQLKGNVNTYS